MRFSKVIFIERGPEEISVQIAAHIVWENGRPYVNDFESDYPLRDAEIDLAHSELIDLARAYPETGKSI